MSGEKKRKPHRLTFVRATASGPPVRRGKLCIYGEMIFSWFEAPKMRTGDIISIKPSDKRRKSYEVKLLSVVEELIQPWKKPKSKKKARKS